SLVRKALEERVDELVVLPNAGRRESTTQEQRVDPVDLLEVQEMLDERALGAEPVANLLPRIVPDFLAREVDHDGLHRVVIAHEVEADRAANTGCQVDALVQ